MNITYQKLARNEPNRSSRYIQPVWLDALSRTRFLTRCRSGEITRAELNNFVEQHQIYSRCFTRYLAALLANIEDDQHRFELTQNLFDEMGLGTAGALPHAKLYRSMMANLGLQPEQTPLPATQHLIDAMFECCRAPSVMVGFGALCLGAEGIVPHIYQQIVDGFLAVGESLSTLQFFTVHIQCDDGHADTMCAIIDQQIKCHPNSLIDLNYGAEKLIRARIDFFESLCAH